jgi:hypothetical protein
MKGDFYYLTDAGFQGVLFIIYVAIIGAYVMKEGALLWKSIAMRRDQLGNSIATSGVPMPLFNSAAQRDCRRHISLVVRRNRALQFRHSLHGD